MRFRDPEAETTFVHDFHVATRWLPDIAATAMVLAAVALLALRSPLAGPPPSGALQGVGRGLAALAPLLLLWQGVRQGMRWRRVPIFGGGLDPQHCSYCLQTSRMVLVAAYYCAMLGPAAAPPAPHRGWAEWHSALFSPGTLLLAGSSVLLPLPMARHMEVQLLLAPLVMLANGVFRCVAARCIEIAHYVRMSRCRWL